MFAKLIIYPTNPAKVNAFTSDKAPVVPSQTSQSALSESVIQWQLVADNLSTGKITELLVCLDELGFNEPDSPFTL